MSLIHHMAVTAAAMARRRSSASWDVTTAVFAQFFSIGGSSTGPNAVFFSDDGTRMFVVDPPTDNVFRWDLSTPWDVSTAVLAQTRSVAAEETSATSQFFKPDGTKMYIAGHVGDDVNEYNLGTPWDLSTTAFVHAFSVAAKETEPDGLFFSSDGTKMFVTGQIGDAVHRYNLGTPWNVSTAVFSQSFSFVAQETLAQEVFFKPDGTRMYVVGVSDFGNQGKIHQYDLSTPWDLSTAVFLSSFSTVAQDTGAEGMFIKPDGSKLYLVGAQNDRVYEYDLT